MSMTSLPADWLNWSVGAGLSMIFLWLISVPAALPDADEALSE